MYFRNTELDKNASLNTEPTRLERCTTTLHEFEMRMGAEVGHFMHALYRWSKA